MQWVYGFVVGDLGLPSQVGYAVLAVLVAIFFYDLYDIYTQRQKGYQAMIWILVVLLVPLGTLIYLLLGRYFLHRAPLPVVPVPDINPTGDDAESLPVTQVSAEQASFNTQRKVTTTIGTIVGVIAALAGAAAVFFFIVITIAIIQCQQDPKCM